MLLADYNILQEPGLTTSENSGGEILPGMMEHKKRMYLSLKKRGSTADKCTVRTTVFSIAPREATRGRTRYSLAGAVMLAGWLRFTFLGILKIEYQIRNAVYCKYKVGGVRRITFRNPGRKCILLRDIAGSNFCSKTPQKQGQTHQAEDINQSAFIQKVTHFVGKEHAIKVEGKKHQQCSLIPGQN